MMSPAARCSAILLTFVLGVTAFGQTSSKTGSKADPTHSVIGVQLYSFRNEMKTDLEGTLEKVKAMGFTYIETGAQSGKSAAEFKALLDKNGLQTVSYFADYNKLKSDFASVVADAKTMNAKYVIVAWIPHQKDFTLADCELAIKDFNEAGEKLAKEGLRFAYHIHGYEFVPHGKGTLMDKLMAETKPQFVNVQMDVFWVAHPGQDPVAFLRKYGKRIRLMHMKDMQKGVKGDLTGHGDVETNVTIGTGSIDYETLVRDAKKLGVKYLIIEDESSRSMTQVPASLKYLTSIK